MDASIHPHLTSAQRVVVESVGSAQPGLAGLLARQLGLPASRVANALYRAPSVLLEDLPPAQAEGLASILQQAGLHIRLEASDTPRPQPGKTLDIALYVRNIAQLPECCQRLAHFLGCRPEAALNMLLTPPGVVLGDVSEATAQALQRHLADLEVELSCSTRAEARYQLLINRAPGPGLDSLLHDLHQQGIRYDPDSCEVLQAIDTRQALYLWRRHQSAGGIRLLDLTFMRYDLSLGALQADSDTSQLPRLAGLPAELIDCVLANLPVVVEEGVAAQNLDSRLAAWRSAKLPVQAVPVTLRQCRLALTVGGNADIALPLLAQAGLVEHSQTRLPLPWRSPVIYGELMPRWLQQALEQLGIEHSWEEMDDGRH
ncbi:hypothetical protein [Halopseudomonas sabulinigri]|uniref:Uncharacterized protein n=1 Tax=Halopseudomonas sabulinigri TaxID=472181 RepID=A0ABP9ZSF6_9GAMM